MNQLTIDFNKEILFGEIGALIGAPSLSFIVSRFTNVANYISTSAVVGALVGASIFWLIMRIYDEEKEKRFSMNTLKSDILYFTPAATVLGLIIYQPVLFLLSHYLLTSGDNVLFSVIGSQVIAFSLFLVSINIYRNLLYKYTKKEL